MPHKFSFGLSTKILIMLVFYITAITMMAYVSYEDLVTTEKKIEVLELSYGIHNMVLEARRFEKNYFLYGHKESLEENKRIIQEALERGQQVIQTDTNLAINPKLKKLDQDIKSYLATVDALQALPATDDRNKTAIAETIRGQGKGIGELSEEVAKYEKSLIHRMITMLRGQLLTWWSIAVSVGIVLSALIVYFIFKPLYVIKKATVDIAQGKFKKLQVINTRDEIQGVMEAFNIMVKELERRQDKLIQAEKLSSLGTLTAGVAHQLNNPLNNISTSCQIAMDEFDGGDTPFLKKMLTNIDQETLRARDVVKNLLEFARAQDFCLRKIPLAEVVKKSALLAKSQVPPHITMSVDIPEDLIVHMDVQRMQEVFINLLINAAQAIDGAGAITITAAMEETSPDIPGKQVVITVHDTGTGISEKNQAKIFDPFFTTKEEGKGTGLGLSVVYGIIQKHQGTISVQSSPGQGTSFFIRLPFPNEQVSA